MNESHALHSKMPCDDPQEQHLLQAIADDPHDDTVRLIYADWLEERQDPRCEYVRLECRFKQLAKQASHTPSKTQTLTGRFQQLRQRLSDLLKGPRTAEERLPAAVQRELQSLRTRMTQLREECEATWLAVLSRSAVSCCEPTVEFQFQCPMKWGDLSPTDDPYVKHCSACDSPVYFEIDLSMAQERASEGKCVCVPVDMTSRPPLQELYDLSAEDVWLGMIVESVDCSENNLRD
ncbi:MAG: TIGR02996 domain-containing protein [Planctomycetaceae bacterium]|nr:TIGR02996 domain-containing protein [Planctomycetaceae bacterium]